MNKSIQLIAVTLLCLFLAGCEQEPSITPSGKTLTIGVIGPMSGSNKMIGETSLSGIETALRISPYLKNGDTIKLIVEDDQNQPQRTVKAFEKMVQAEKVSAILLLSTSRSVLAVDAVADNYQVPVLVLAASHRDIARDREFVNQLSMDDSSQGKVAALFVRDELLVDRVAVFHNPDGLHSTSLAHEFITTFKSTEGVVVESLAMSAGSVDLEKKLGQLREQNVQLVYLSLSAEKIVEMARILRKMHWSPGLMAGDNTLSTLQNRFNKKLGLVDGLLAVDLYSDNLRRSSYALKAGKVYSSLYKIKPTTYAGMGFEGTVLLKAAMDRCPDPSDTVCVNRMIRLTENFDGIMGKITIQPDGKARRPLIVNRIRKNQTEFVVKVY